MGATRAALSARLRRARTLVLAGVVVVTAGLSAAVSAAIPGRSAAPAPTVDPFSEPLTAFAPAGSAGVAPASSSAAPVAVAGAS